MSGFLAFDSQTDSQDENKLWAKCEAMEESGRWMPRRLRRKNRLYKAISHEGDWPILAIVAALIHFKIVDRINLKQYA